MGQSARTYTMTGLQAATKYRGKLRACNGTNSCSRWSADHLFDTPKAPPPPSLIPATQTIAIGEDAKVEAHDVPADIDAVFRVTGPIQPRGRCPPGGAAASASTGSGYYNAIWVTGCAPGGTGEVRLVERTNEANVLATATVVVAQTTWPSHIRNLRLTAQGDGAVTLAWDPPERTGGSPIVGYGVQHRRDGAAWASEVPAGRDTSGIGTTHTVTGLTNGVKYHFRVTPCNQAKAACPGRIRSAPSTPPSAARRRGRNRIRGPLPVQRRRRSTFPTAAA